MVFIILWFKILWVLYMVGMILLIFRFLLSCNFIFWIICLILVNFCSVRNWVCSGIIIKLLVVSVFKVNKFKEGG